MRILIRPSVDWPRESLSFVRTRLEFSLGRFPGRVRSLTVHLSDVNGPRGGPDKRCLIALRLTRPRRLIVVEEIDTDAGVVVSRAAQRASRAVSRVVQATEAWRDHLRLR